MIKLRGGQDARVVTGVNMDGQFVCVLGLTMKVVACGDRFKTYYEGCDGSRRPRSMTVCQKDP